MVLSVAAHRSFLSWMSSLADDMRIRLLRVLERHELGVVELCDVLQRPQSTVSRHLKVLADQHWVRGRRQGTTRLYRMILDELDPAARKLWLVTREQTDAWPAVKHDALRLERVLQQRQIDSQSFFAGAAAEWNSLRQSLYGSHFSVAAMLALLPAELVVADLGCGTGQLAAMLAPHVGRVIGVDNSPAMLKAAKRRLAGCANVELRLGELTALPIETASCDTAMIVLTLTYIPEPPRAIAEAARILRPGGKLVMVDLLPHDRDDFRRQMGQIHPGFDPAAMERTMTSAGFSAVAVQPLAAEKNAKGPALFQAVGRRDGEQRRQ